MGKRSRRPRDHASSLGELRQVADHGSEHGTSEVTGVVFSIAATLFGLSVGYVIALQSRPRTPSAPTTVAQAAPAQGGTSTPVLADEQELAALREILGRDPNNLSAATALANRLYDAGRYADAIPYYQTAVRLAPSDPGLSTDLGTALWYSGRADDALRQYERSLAADPTHAQTLFNIGIVSLEGASDPARAVESWERLLTTYPAHPERDRIEALMAQARDAMASRPPTR